MFFKKNFSTYISVFLSILVFFAFSISQINLENLWFDELMTFWITNPEVNNHETFKKIINYENTPPLYYFILKYFFKIFGYDYQLIRVPNIIFHIFSIFVFYSILIKISKDKFFVYLAMILFSSNYFLISYAQEARVFIFFCLTSLCFINFYLIIRETDFELKGSNLLFLFIFGLILLSSFIFSFVLIGSLFFYEFFFEKKNKKYFAINGVVFLSIIISIFFNIEFYKSILNFEAVSISNQTINFYIFNYFFKQFFGSKIMGYLFILFFLISIIYLIKNRNKDKKLLFLLLIVFFSYSVPIAYGYLFSPVLQDKYIIYVIPIVLIFISYAISKIHNFKLKISMFVFLILVSIINQSLKNFKKEIDKPQFEKILNEVNLIDEINFYEPSFMDNNNKLYNELVDNYLRQIIKKNNLILTKKVDESKKFWIICYDPSNTYQYCLKRNKLSENFTKTIKHYQTIAILIDKE